MSTPAVTKIRGYEGQLYYTPNGGARTLYANISDWELDIKADEIDFSDHSAQGWKDKASGLKEFSGTIKAMAIVSGVDEANFFAALSGGINLAADFRPQDVTGGKCYLGTISITGYKHASPNSGAQTVDITFSGRGVLTTGVIAAAGQ
jgi:hypothetical protein